eukprot:scaffold533_cov369-Prasinococcus_capsulatus_cf.AAC.7
MKADKTHLCPLARWLASSAASSRMKVTQPLDAHARCAARRSCGGASEVRPQSRRRAYDPRRWRRRTSHCRSR